MKALTDIKTPSGSVDGVSVVSKLIRLVDGKHHVVEVPNDDERAYLKESCGLDEETGNVSAKSEFELSQCLALLEHISNALTGRINRLVAA